MSCIGTVKTMATRRYQRFRTIPLLTTDHENMQYLKYTPSSSLHASLIFPPTHFYVGQAG
jgi:hypothetical protein